MTKNTHRKTGTLVDPENREKDDFSETSEDAVLRLLERERFEGAIWEPACGKGAISAILAANGYDVISSDLVDRGFGETRIDFLMEYRPRSSNIITNPPFKLATEFILKSMELTTGKVAMFLPLAYLAGQGRKRDLWDATPLKTVHVFSYRVDCWRHGIKPDDASGSTINFAWYIWEHGYKGDPVIKFI